MGWRAEVRVQEPPSEGSGAHAFHACPKMTMPLTDIEREISKSVVQHFYVQRESVSHEQLLRTSKNPTAIIKVKNLNLISALSNIPQPRYVPTILAFQYSGDDTLLREAKKSVEIVIERLKSLFESNFDSSRDHHPAALVSEDDPMNSDQELKMIALGLFLAKDIPGVFFGVQLSDQKTQVASFRISEHILTQEPSSVWDEYIRAHSTIEVAPKPEAAIVKPVQIPAPKRAQEWPPVRWKILESLGEGGQGWTYKVRRRDGSDRDLYVLKRLKNKERLPRFRNEIAALTKLQHRGILRIVETSDELESPFFVAEYCDGSDLGKANLLTLDLLTKLRMFRQVCDAVAAAHGAHILHRDLKPQNIFLRKDGSIVVGDFGLCIDLQDIKDRATQTLEAVGAERYIAPEVEKGRVSEPQPTSDLYSLGKVLYFILSGRTLIREEYGVGEDDIRTRDAGPNMHFVYELFDKTITERPEDRYQSAADLLYALDTVIERVQLKAHILQPSVRQHCLFCVIGEYRRATGGSGYEMMYVCSNCGNIQKFTGAPSGSWWEQK